MKKIFFLAPGNSIHSVRWIKNYEKDFKIVWFSLHPFIDESNELNQSIEKAYVKLSPASFIKCLLTFRKMIIFHKPDIIHVHSLARYLVPLIATLFMKLPSLILSPWGSDIVYSESKFINKTLLKIFFRKAYLIISDSRHISEKCHKISNSSRSKTIEIYHGSDPEIFFPLNRELNPNEIKFLSVRLLEEIYNIDVIIKAFSIVQEKLKNKNHKLTICADGSKKNELMELANNLLTPNTFLFTGRLSQIEMRNEIQACDVVISASQSDGGLSASLGESMMCKKTILASSSGGENDLWITDGINGYLFDCQDEKELAGRMIKCTNIEFLKKSSQMNYEKSMEKYNLKKERLKMKEIYLRN